MSYPEVLRSAPHPFRLFVTVLAFLFLPLLFSCNLTEEDGQVYMQVTVDSSWSAYEVLEITWKDTATGKEGVFFRGSPADLKASSKVRADGYDGGKIVITIRGMKGDSLVYEEVRGYDGANPGSTTRDIIRLPSKDSIPRKPDTTRSDTLRPDTTRPDTARPDTSKPVPGRPRILAAKTDYLLTPGDSAAFSVTASVTPGTLKSYSWDYDEDGTADGSGTLSGASAEIKGGRRYSLGGDYTAVLTVVSSSDSSAKAEFRIRVVQDPPKADAGADITVYPGDDVRLRGIAKDSLGRVTRIEWKVGDAPFVEAPADTTFKAPSAPADLSCILRVTDDDGQSRTDTVVVHVVSRTQSVLTGLSASRGSLSPQFSPSVTAYANTVPYEISSLTVTASGNGTLRVDGKDVQSGKPSDPIELRVGTTDISIRVDLPGADARTYTLAVTRLPASSDADLSALTLSAGALEPAFRPGDTAYAVHVPNGTLSTTVTATAASGLSSIAVNGAPVASGSPSESFSLPVGTTTLSVAVTSQGGQKKTYAVQITRAGNANAYLSSLALSAGSIVPAFFPSTFAYSLSAPNWDSSTTLTAVEANPNASLAVNGKPVSSGAAVEIPLQVGANTLTVEVTAQSGAKNIYTVQVTRAGNPNANLSALSLSAGAIPAPFDPEMVFYTFSVGNGTQSTTVTATVANASASLAIDGKPAASGSPATVALPVGIKVIEVVVTSQSGAEKKYSIQITRAANGNADLASLELSVGPLTPEFDPSRTSYAVSVPHNATSTTLTFTNAAATSVDSIGNKPATPGQATPAINLNVGANPINVLVTAENGARKIYSVVVTRAGSPNADLASLSLGAGSITPAFAAGTTQYTLSVANSVASTTIAAAAADAFAIVDIQPGTPANLGVGLTSLAVKVTAQDGTVKTYSIQVTRARNGNADLSGLIVSAGAFTPAFSASVTSYTLNVPNLTVSTTITATAAAGTSKLKVKDKDQASGIPTSALNLDVGANTIPIEVTAEDGTVKTYTLTVNRAVSTDASLQSLTATASPASGPAVPLAIYPDFSSSVLPYFSHPKNAATTIRVRPTAVQSGSAILVNGQGVVSGNEFAIPVSTTGPTTATIEVTAPDGSTKRTYTLTVARNRDVGFACSYNRTYKTYDAGNTWVPTNGAGFEDIAFSDPYTGIGTGSSGHIYKTVDGGLNWVVKASPTPNTNRSVLTTGASTWFTIGTSYIMKSTDGGETWANKHKEPDANVTVGHFFDANNGFLLGYSGFILWTSDAGETWTRKGMENNAYFGLAFTDKNTGFAVGSSGIIMKTVDGGNTWTYKDWGKNSWLYDVYFHDANTGYAVGGNKGILKTTDGGETWTEKAGGGTAAQLIESVTFLDANTGFAVGGGIWRTSDAGETWTEIPGYSGVGFHEVMFLK